MSPIEWYYARGDDQVGPVPSAELRQLAAAGGLQPDDLVWREGMEQWVAARNLKGLFEPAAAEPAETLPKAPGSLAEGAQAPRSSADTAAARPAVPGRAALNRPRRRAAGHLFDIMLEAIRAQCTAEFVDSTTKIFVTGGHYCLYVAMLASFSVALILGIKTGLLQPVLLGALGLLILAVLQYAAMRFCAALERLNRTTGGNTCSTAFLDCFALLNMAVGLAVLLGLAILAVQTVLPKQSGAFSLILLGMVVFIVCQYVAFISLNPKTLGIRVVPEARAGEEAVGVLSFLLKAMLRLVPVAFGAGVVYGTLGLFYACFLVFVPPEAPDQVKPLLGPEKLPSLQPAADAASAPTAPVAWAAQGTAIEAMQWIIAFAALPFLTYVVFLLLYLSVDLIRAVLSIPGRLDALVEKQQEENGGRSVGPREDDRE